MKKHRRKKTVLFNYTILDGQIPASSPLVGSLSPKAEETPKTARRGIPAMETAGVEPASENRFM